MPSIQEVRQKFPQYSDMSDQQLADSLYAKYYSDLPRDQFNASIGLAPPVNPKDQQVEETRVMPAWQRAIEQGGSLSLGDEAAAAGTAAGAFLKTLPQGFDAAKEAAGKRYDEKLGFERTQGRKFATENPWTNAALETAGGFVMGPQQQAMGLASGAKPPSALSASSPLGVIGKSAATGATLGAAQGFGSGEGGLENRAVNAGITGAITGVLGGAIPAIGYGAGAGWDAAKNLLAKTNADDQAKAFILKAMQADNISVDDAIAKYQAAGGKPIALVDIGGENVKGLARGAAATPGPARQQVQDFVATRQAGQGSRIADDIATSISPNANYAGTVDDLVAAQSAKAGPLYDRVVRPENLVPDDQFANLAKDPFLAKTIGEVRSDPLFGMEDLPPNSLPVLDAAKKRLDDLIATARRGGEGNRARLLMQRKDALVTAADQAFPDYKLAREAFSGPAQSMDALELGRNILKESGDVTAKAIKELGEGDREFFKAGVVRAIKDAADNAPDGVDITKRFFGKPALREKLQAAFDSPEQFSAFENAIKTEAAMFETSKRINPRATSGTTPMANEAGALTQNPLVRGAVQFGRDLTKDGGGMFNAIGGAARGLMDRSRGLNPQVNEKLAQMLLQTDQQFVTPQLRQLGQQATTDNKRALEMARQLGLIGSTSGVYGTQSK